MEFWTSAKRATATSKNGKKSRRSGGKRHGAPRLPGSSLILLAQEDIARGHALHAGGEIEQASSDAERIRRGGSRCRRGWLRRETRSMALAPRGRGRDLRPIRKWPMCRKAPGIPFPTRCVLL